jgi:hypothetical protein
MYNIHVFYFDLFNFILEFSGLLPPSLTHLKIDNFAFENVENFNYLGSILNADNKMNTKIAERIVKGNKAYYANAGLIKSKLLKRNAKMKIYKTLIRPFVMYSSETWTLTAKYENNLRIFERQILRKMLDLLILIIYGE